MSSPGVSVSPQYRWVERRNLNAVVQESLLDIVLLGRTPGDIEAELPAVRVALTAEHYVAATRPLCSFAVPLHTLDALHLAAMVEARP